MKLLTTSVMALTLSIGCGTGKPENRCATQTCTTAADNERGATLAVKQYIELQLDVLEQASRDLQSRAPAADADGWNATTDASAVTSMREAWGRARDAYERIEGAIAVLFPEIDVSTDARYDAFVEALTARGMRDDDLFDGQGVTGMHAIERILWAGSHSPTVVQFESGLAGYVAAGFPTTMTQANAFKTGLCQRLIDDVVLMRRTFRPLALDAAAAFRGVIASMGEQVEKIEKAAAGEEESRYSNRTLADMRANLEGGVQTFALFRPWLSFVGQTALIASVDARFEAVRMRYASFTTESLPAVPAGYLPDNPSATDQQSAYHQLRVFLGSEADPAVSGSLVQLMNSGADSMSIPRIDR